MSYLKPFPRIIHHGINDKSRRVIPLDPERLPQHLPIAFLLTEKAEEVQIASGSYLTERYGSAMMDSTSPFYNHQSVLARHVLARGNQIMVVPIKLPDSKKASLRISAEVTAFTHVAENGEKTNKIRLIWHADEIPDGDFSRGRIKENYRPGTTTSVVGNKRLGILIDDDGKEYQLGTTLFPIFDFQAESRGAYGNSFGIAIDAPLESDSYPTDNTLADRLKSFVYRMSIAKKDANGITSTRVPNRFAEPTTDFVLTPNAVDNRTTLQVSFGEVITDRYEKTLDPDVPPVLSPLNDTAIYQDNLATVLELVANTQVITAEAVGGTDVKDFTVSGLFRTMNEAHDNLYSTNIITGRDVQGNPYRNLDMSDAYAFGGITFGRDSAIFCRGGSDGFPRTKAGTIDTLETLRLYDEAVRDWCDNFNEYNELYDSARYPFSTLYDSGFSIDTKLSLIKPIGQHHRIYTILGTQSVADYADIDKTYFAYMQPNTGAQEVAIATRLNAAMHLYPESDLYGTSVCRGAIVGRCGELRDGSYNGILPLTIAIASKLAAYCGAGDGYWKSEYAIDDESNRIETLFKNVNLTYQPSSIYDASWSAGMIWVQNFDRNSTFFPAYQTVYNDSTSVLDGLLTIVAASYIQRVGERVWRELSGNGTHGKEKFLEVSDNKILEYADNRFDNRITIVPETYYTAADELRGYSWSTLVRMYAENMRFVNQFTIESYRREDLTN